MDDMEVKRQQEELAFDEKVALAELEVSKALERVRELLYSKARFKLDFFTNVTAKGVDHGQKIG